MTKPCLFSNRITWLKGKLRPCAGGLMSQWGRTIKSPWLHIIIHQYPSWYDLEYKTLANKQTHIHTLLFAWGRLAGSGALYMLCYLFNYYLNSLTYSMHLHPPPNIGCSVQIALVGRDWHPASLTPGCLKSAGVISVVMLLGYILSNKPIWPAC